MRLILGQGAPLIAYMGDPHLGRRFITGVPLHRRGDREAWVQRDFVANLDDVEGCPLHVCMGDLFDKAQVPNHVVAFAAHSYQRAALDHPDTIFVVLRGNHDAGGDEEATTSFDIFRYLMRDVSNVVVVDREPHTLEVGGHRFSFCPWRRDVSAERQVTWLGGETAVFGHWDVHSFGDTRNLAPTAELGRLGIPWCVTGHDHNPAMVDRDGVALVATGSLQPYSHGEDKPGRIYRTTDLDTALRLGSEVRDLALRIRLAPGERLPHDLDCLQLTEFGKTELAEISVGPIDLGNLDVGATWAEAMTEHGVTSGLSDRLLQMYRDREVP